MRLLQYQPVRELSTSILVLCHTPVAPTIPNSTRTLYLYHSSLSQPCGFYNINQYENSQPLSQFFLTTMWFLQYQPVRELFKSTLVLCPNPVSPTMPSSTKTLYLYRRSLSQPCGSYNINQIENSLPLSQFFIATLWLQQYHPVREISTTIFVLCHNPVHPTISPSTRTRYLCLNSLSQPCGFSNTNQYEKSLPLSLFFVTTLFILQYHPVRQLSTYILVLFHNPVAHTIPCSTRTLCLYLSSLSQPCYSYNTNQYVNAQPLSLFFGTTLWLLQYQPIRELATSILAVCHHPVAPTIPTST